MISRNQENLNAFNSIPCNATFHKDQKLSLRMVCKNVIVLRILISTDLSRSMLFWVEPDLFDSCHMLDGRSGQRRGWASSSTQCMADSLVDVSIVQPLRALCYSADLFRLNKTITELIAMTRGVLPSPFFLSRARTCHFSRTL